jgi:D-3-phosphoglycerate dehydrogenase
MAKIMICDIIHEDGVKLLKEAGHTLAMETEITPEELPEKIGEYDAIVIRSRTIVTRQVLDTARNLKAIARAGVGLDNIDLEYAKEKGVTVFNSPEAPCNAVTELALGLMLSLARYIPKADSGMKQGKWDKKNLTGTELKGKTLGIIGFGRIGYTLAEKSKRLGMRVLVNHYDLDKIKKQADEMGVEAVDLDKLYAESDYISLHVPMRDTTKHMISKESLSKMKKGVRIINTARGGVIDEKALIEALDSGKVAGAALDVFEEEPNPSQILVKRSDVICTPHIGAGSVEAQIGNSTVVADKLIKFFNS